MDTVILAMDAAFDEGRHADWAKLFVGWAEAMAFRALPDRPAQRRRLVALMLGRQAHRCKHSLPVLCS